MIKIGLVGCGKQSEKYAQSLLKNDDIIIVATDINEQARQSFAAKFNCLTTESVKELFQDRDIDGGIICTPVSVHKKVSQFFIDLKVPFLSEKPLAISALEAFAIADAAEKMKVSGGVTYTYRYVPAFATLNAELKNNDCALGKPVTAIFRVGGRGNHRIWKHMKPEGGVTNEMFCHMLDLSLWLFGEFVSLNIRDQKLLQPIRTIEGREVKIDTEDYTYIEGITKSGVQCIFISDFITPSFSQYLEIQGTNGSFFGSIQPHFQSRFLINQDKGKMKKGDHSINVSGPSVIDRITLELIDVINGKSNFRCSLSDASRTQKYLDEIINQLS